MTVKSISKLYQSSYSDLGYIQDNTCKNLIVGILYHLFDYTLYNNINNDFKENTNSLFNYLRHGNT